MIRKNGIVTTKAGDKAVIISIDDTGLFVKYLNGRRKGWTDYITIQDIQAQTPYAMLKAISPAELRPQL